MSYGVGCGKNLDIGMSEAEDMPLHMSTPTKKEKTSEPPSVEKQPPLRRANAIDTEAWEIALSICPSRPDAEKLIQCLSAGPDDNAIVEALAATAAPEPTDKRKCKEIAIGNRKVKKIKTAITKKADKEIILPPLQPFSTRCNKLLPNIGTISFVGAISAEIAFMDAVHKSKNCFYVGGSIIPKSIPDRLVDHPDRRKSLRVD